MARPKVLVSSTYYDLKHFRSSLESFIESLGFEAVLSETGAIPYSSDQPHDESCYDAVRGVDIMVLIVGGRYGSRASDQESREKYDSVTRREWRTAVAADVAIYVLIENNVDAEYQTFLKNRGKEIEYSHADSEAVYEMVEEIHSQSRNNPIHRFERFGDVESWLREQWAGEFQKLLANRKDNRSIASLSDKLVELEQINKTLKSYLESLVQNALPNDAESLIQSESEKHRNLSWERLRTTAPVIQWLMREFSEGVARNMIESPTINTVSELTTSLCAIKPIALGVPGVDLEKINMHRNNVGLTNWTY